MDNLRQIRENIYRLFDVLSTPSDFLRIQRVLASELIRAEKGIKTEKKNDDYNTHRNTLYSVGDALVWKVLHPFTIRQLGRYDSNYIALLPQENEFNELLEHYESLPQTSIYLFSDLTRCITVGDVIQANGPEDIVIHESKTSASENISLSELLSGRTGRQFSKNFWITEYLKKGIGKLFGYPQPFQTVLSKGSQTSYFHLLPDLIEKCLNNPKGGASIRPEKGLSYFAQQSNYKFSSESLQPPEPINKILLASTFGLIENKNEAVYHVPIMCFPLSLEHRILLNELDVVLYGMVSTGYIDEVASQYGYRFTIEKEVPTLYKADKPFPFHIRFINDLLIGYRPVREAIEEIISAIETAFSNPDEMEKKLNEYKTGLPSNKEELMKSIEDKFSLERKEKKIIIKHST